MVTNPIKLSKEDDVWLLPSRWLGNITGYPEYVVAVYNYVLGEEYERLVAPIMSDVCLKGNEVVSVPRWVDTTTGTVYSLEGKAYGPLMFMADPLTTGRTVPVVKQRNDEARLRYLNNQAGDTQDANDE